MDNLVLETLVVTGMGMGLGVGIQGRRASRRFNLYFARVIHGLLHIYNSRICESLITLLPLRGVLACSYAP